VRAIPIDDFFEDLEERGGAGTTSAYDWRRLVSEGRAARGAMDGGKWRIGMLALLVERRYASGALQRFADDIGESYGSVRRYRWVAKSYDPNARTRFADLSFSHFQAVAGLPDKLAWLARAERGSWSVDRLTRESRAESPAKPPKRVEDPLPGLRRSLDGLRRWVEPASLLDDIALGEAGRDWLADELDALAESIGRLRERVHRATQRADALKSPKVARVRATRARPARKVAASENGKTRNTALKARAVGR
jgi:hypothetical protein